MSLDRMIPEQIGLLLTLLGYMGGCFLASYYLPLWLKGIDVTAAPADHNPGASNAFSAAGIPMGILCLVLDICKGVLPVAIGVLLLGVDSPWIAMLMIAPVAGHVFPAQRHFRGGKGIAASFGVLVGLWPAWQAFLLLAVIYIFFSVVLVVSPNRTRSIVTFFLWAAGVLFLVPLPAVRFACLIIGGMVIYRHVCAAATEPTAVHLFRKA